MSARRESHNQGRSFNHRNPDEDGDDDGYERRGPSRRQFDGASTDEDEQKEAWGERSTRGRGRSAADDDQDDDYRGSESKRPSGGGAFVRADSKGTGGATKSLRDDSLMVKDISSSSSDDDAEVSYRPQRTQRVFKQGGARPVPPKAPAGLSVVAARNSILSGSAAASGGANASSSFQESSSLAVPKRAPAARAVDGRGSSSTRRDYKDDEDDEDDSDGEAIDSRYKGQVHGKSSDRRAGSSSPRRRGGSRSSEEGEDGESGSRNAPVAASGNLRSETDAADRSARFTTAFAPHPGPRHEIVDRVPTSAGPLAAAAASTATTASASSGLFNSNRTSTTHENSMHSSVQEMSAKLTERFKSGAFVLTAHESGGYTDLVQCLIVREKSTLAMETCYSMYLEDSNKLLIYARKKNLSRTSNYHLYDMTRGLPSKHLSKKSGNYLGKLRAMNLTSTEYAVVTQASEREEVAAIVYDQVGIVDQLKDGSQPRRMSVMLPMLDADSLPIPNAVGEADEGSMVQMLKSAQQGKMFVFRTKEPKFENGNYRLNFHGRVSVPSVKNYQLVSDDEPEHVVCQFGKIGDDRFHLDYKAPLNAFQAFAIALTQFNL